MSKQHKDDGRKFKPNNGHSSSFALNLMKLLGLSFILISLITSQVFSRELSDTNLILSHLQEITKTESARTFDNIKQLNKTADYIHSIFRKYSDNVSFQNYDVNGKTYKNVICSFGPENSARIVVGAHYDVCTNQQGADDNASGVVALLEIARLLKDEKLSYRIDLVAFSLEEPPYFRTKEMGSYIHARSLNESKNGVYGMISLEMIGFFSEAKKSQSYPLGFLSIFYGQKGNYITLVKKWGAGDFARKFSRKFRKVKSIRTKKFSGPSYISGIDFSDHMNYWQFKYSALMITDTAFYRNKNYHKSTDVLETLNISKMAKVIDSTFLALLAL